MHFDWKLGFEIELLAPPDSDRFALANELAQRCGGNIEGFFHPDAEPSKVPGQKLFHNLTPAFTVLDANGDKLCHVVDDITIRDDLNAKAPPKPGWYRMVSDDIRLMRLVARHSNPFLPIERSLAKVASFFGQLPEDSGDGFYRLSDEYGASIAMTAPLPGERERPCELVTTPIEHNHKERLTVLLETARELGFTAPKEGAIHIHFDAEKLSKPAVLLRLALLLNGHRRHFQQLVGTNPACRRLGPWSEPLVALLKTQEFQEASWDDARKMVFDNQIKLSKYRDFNVRNMLMQLKKKNTFEVRTLPVTLDVDELLRMAGLFYAILQRATETTPLAKEVETESPTKETFTALLQDIPLPPKEREHWLQRLAGLPVLPELPKKPANTEPKNTD